MYTFDILTSALYITLNIGDIFLFISGFSYFLYTPNHKLLGHLRLGRFVTIILFIL